MVAAVPDSTIFCIVVHGVGLHARLCHSLSLPPPRHLHTSNWITSQDIPTSLIRLISADTPKRESHPVETCIMLECSHIVARLRSRPCTTERNIQ